MAESLIVDDSAKVRNILEIIILTSTNKYLKGCTSVKESGGKLRAQVKAML